MRMVIALRTFLVWMAVHSAIQLSSWLKFLGGPDLFAELLSSEDFQSFAEDLVMIIKASFQTQNEKSDTLEPTTSNKRASLL